MKRKIISPILLFASSVFLLLSCTKEEGPAGATGAQGPAGPAGTAGVGKIKTRDIIIPATAWAWSATAPFEASYFVSNPDITSDVATKGSVIAYQKQGAYWEKLPLVQFSTGGNVYTYRFVWSQGQMAFNQQFSNGQKFTLYRDTIRVLTKY